MKYLLSILIIFLFNCGTSLEESSNRIISIDTDKGCSYFDAELNFFCTTKKGKCEPPWSNVYFSDSSCNNAFIGGYNSESDFIKYRGNFYSLGKTFSPSGNVFVYYFNEDSICLRTTLFLTSLRLVKEIDSSILGDIPK